MIWKPVNYPGVKADRYLVSENGDIKSLYHHGKIMRQYLVGDYLYISLRDQAGVSRLYKVHRIVCYAFHGYPPVSMEDPTVNHIDYNPQNNNYKNLEWMERKDNCGNHLEERRLLGERHGEAKLTNKEVEEICKELSETNHTLKSIADKYGISISVINSIAQERTWKFISEKYVKEMKRHGRLRNRHVVEICGESRNVTDWCKAFGISRDTFLKRVKELGCTEESAICTPKMTSHEWVDGGYTHEQCVKRYNEVIKHNAETDKGQ